TGRVAWRGGGAGSSLAVGAGAVSAAWGAGRGAGGGRGARSHASAGSSSIATHASAAMSHGLRREDVGGGGAIRTGRSYRTGARRAMHQSFRRAPASSSEEAGGRDVASGGG